MAKISSFSVIALLACLVAVSAGLSPFEDEEGKLCGLCATTDELKLVCGSNGLTYLNPSSLKCHDKCLKSGVTQKHFGPCHDSPLFRKVPNSDCPCVATREYFPVCGTNGKTYSNKSVLKCAAKCQKTNIQLKHFGKC